MQGNVVVGLQSVSQVERVTRRPAPVAMDMNMHVTKGKIFFCRYKCTKKRLLFESMCGRVSVCALVTFPLLYMLSLLK